MAVVYEDPNLFDLPDEIWVLVSEKLFKLAGHLGPFMARFVCRQWSRCFKNKSTIEDLVADLGREYRKNILEYFDTDRILYGNTRAVSAMMTLVWNCLLNDHDVNRAQYFANKMNQLSSIVSSHDHFYVMGHRCSGKTTLIKNITRRLTEMRLEEGMPSFDEFQIIDLKEHGEDLQYRIRRLYRSTIHTRSNEIYLLIPYEEGREEYITRIFNITIRPFRPILSDERYNKILNMYLKQVPEIRPGCYRRWLMISLVLNIQLWIQLVPDVGENVG